MQVSLLPLNIATTHIVRVRIGDPHETFLQTLVVTLQDLALHTFITISTCSQHYDVMVAR